MEPKTANSGFAYFTPTKLPRWAAALSVGAAALVAGGCRTADLGTSTPAYSVPQTTKSMGGDSFSESARSDHDQLQRLPKVEPSPIRQVAYEEESNPNGSPGATIEFVPTPAVEEEPAVEKEVASTLTLTLVDLEGIASRNNPALTQAAERVEAAQGAWLQAGLPPNPVVGYSGQQLGSGGAAEQHGVYFSQEWITGGKLRLGREQAAWEVARAERQRRAFELRVLTDVRIGFYDVLIAQRRRQLTADLVRISEQGEETARALFKGGEISEADPLRARVEADMARILHQTAANQHAEAWRRLAAVLGMPEMAVQRLEGDLNADELELSWQDTLRRTLSESPEMAAAIAKVEAARWAVERACAEAIPNVEVQAVVQDDRGTGSTNGNLQVSVPIPFWNRNQGGVYQAQAEAAAATRGVDRLALDIQSRLAAAFQRYESARNQVKSYARKDGILDNAERTLELVRSGYRAEEFGALDLLGAQKTYSQTNLAYLDAQRELWTSAMEIKGLLLRDSLSE